ncbi:MAG: KamA family radical SAM protein [Alphaproteobacteria bacterium]|nr:KamA family radical SAM protein [Alphaproteobacteria bacterium]
MGSQKQGRPEGETNKAVRPQEEEPPSTLPPPPHAAPTAAAIALASTRKVNRFPVSREAREFYRRFYPGSTPDEWNDWRWQSRHRIRTLAELERIFVLSEDERSAAASHKGSLPVGITPYYATRMSLTDPMEPLRRTHVMVGAENIRLPGEDDDPLGEDHDTKVPGLVHRYPDRVLFLTTGFCSTYCRYCTRSRVVGNPGGEYQFSTGQWEKALAYLEQHTEVRDVLLSGGDPLSIGDEKLDWLLTRLRRIKHIEFLRIGTKIPSVLPMRITRDLVRVLKKHHPLWMSIHVTHPSEFSPEMSEGLSRLADAGIPLGSQTVLLKDINDDIAIMRPLMQGLLKRRVKPYYLYQCDPIKGSGHFRTSVDKGLEIIAGLRGHTTGYACPMFVVDAPGGGGKILLAPDAVAGRDGDDLLLRNFEGRIYRYPDPEGSLGRRLALPLAAE